MQRISTRAISCLLLIAVIGCGNTESPAEFLTILAAHPGLRIEIRPILPALEGEMINPRSIEVVAVTDESIHLEWQEKRRVESTDSLRIRRRFAELMTGVPDSIEEIPPQPTPQFEQLLVTSRIRGIAPWNSRNSLLPALWPEGQYEFPHNALLWISPAAFRELKKEGSCEWHSGIFNHQLPLEPAKVDRARPALKFLQYYRQHKEEQQEPLARLFQVNGPQQMPLKINGEEWQLPVLHARTWYGSLVILDRREHPLILRFLLAPEFAIPTSLIASFGSLKTGFGYQVVAMRTAGGKNDAESDPANRR